MINRENVKLLLVGAGKMGGAMFKGWLGSSNGEPSCLRPNQISVSELNPSQIVLSRIDDGVRLLDHTSVEEEFDVVVLAIKPQTLDDAKELLARIAKPNTLIISVLAGKTIADIQERAPAARSIIRAMPNTPASVNFGISGCVASADVTSDQRALAEELLRCVGEVVWVSSEEMIDAVTAVSGSGPAYVFHLVEAMALAGERVGLPADVALQLARATVVGSGILLHYEPETPASTLRQNVTSPGGTTAAALEVLMGDNGLTPLMTKAIAAAKNRAEELSG